jgi:hypothetical protein
MADRGDDTPLAPRRTLTGPDRTEPEQPNKPSLTERMSAATGRATERVSAAVSATSSAAKEAVASPSAHRSATARPTAPPPAAARKPVAGRPRVRKARLRLVHVDPWSVMKTAFLLSIALGIVIVVAVAVVWGVLGAAGVWDAINRTVTNVLGSGSGSSFHIENYVGTSRVLGFTMIVAVVDVVLITAIATLGAFLYNLAAALLGGLEVTFAEDDHR